MSSEGLLSVGSVEQVMVGYAEILSSPDYLLYLCVPCTHIWCVCVSLFILETGILLVSFLEDLFNIFIVFTQIISYVFSYVCYI